MNPTPYKLLELARQRFLSRKLSVAEEKLFRGAETGEVSSVLSGKEAEDDPQNAHTWGADRVVAAECITWLCTHEEASRLITHRGIQVTGVRVDSDLELQFANFEFPLSIASSSLAGIFLHRARFPELSLQGSHIKGLRADGASINGPVFLRKGFRCDGEVRLVGAMISGTLTCLGAHLNNAKGDAMNADGVRIDGDFNLGDCSVDGQIRFLGAKINGNVDCRGTRLSNSGDDAIAADGASVMGDVFLRQIPICEGAIRLIGATISGDISCDNTWISNPSGTVLNLDRTKIEGSVFLRNNFGCQGQVRIMGATINGNLECDGARLSNPGGTVLNIEGTRFLRNVFLRRGFYAKGRVNLASAIIEGSLHIYGLTNSQDLILNLRHSRIGTLWDDQASWPAQGNLFLDGFQYDRLSETSPLNAKSRNLWLSRQRADQFLPQPFEQLAMALRAMGHNRDARLIMIEKNRARARHADFLSQDWWWYRAFGRAIGYGYRPWRAFAMSLAVIIVGAVLFATGFRNGLISPTSQRISRQLGTVATRGTTFPDDYPVFNAFAYSLEAFTPLLKLDQTASWQPNANRGAPLVILGLATTTGALLRYYLWAHITLGWVLTTLWIGAVSGLIKT
jgi:hypothetical protein